MSGYGALRTFAPKLAAWLPTLLIRCGQVKARGVSRATNPGLAYGHFAAGGARISPREPEPQYCRCRRSRPLFGDVVLTGRRNPKTPPAGHVAYPKPLQPLDAGTQGGGSGQ